MTQELFKLEYISEDANEKIHGGYKSSGLGAYTHPTRPDSSASIRRSIKPPCNADARSRPLT